MKKKVIRKKKIMIIEAPKAIAPTQKEAEIMALKSLVNQEGWQILVRIMEENISVLDFAILNKLNPETREPLTNEEVDKARDKRMLNIELKDLPNNYLKALLEEDRDTTPDLDPFWNNADAMRKAEQG
jgi:hypothetical protein